MNQRQDGAEWVLLGTLNLTAAASKVTLVPSADGIVAADAVKAVNTSEASRIFFVHADHLNAPRVVLDGGNRLRWRWISDPFGQLPPEENPANLGAFPLNLRFPGQLFDRESNLHYNYFRDYNPQTGRYVQSDPIGLEGGINTYAYVEGNPVLYIDPEGLKSATQQSPYARRGGVEWGGRLPPVSPAFRPPNNAFEAAGYFNPDGQWVCLRWYCPQATSQCTPRDTRRSSDFIPEAIDANSPPSGCVCDAPRFRMPNEPTPGLLDYLDIGTKTDEMLRNPRRIRFR